MFIVLAGLTGLLNVTPPKKFADIYHVFSSQNFSKGLNPKTKSQNYGVVGKRSTNEEIQVKGGNILQSHEGEKGEIRKEPRAN